MNRVLLRRGLLVVAAVLSVLAVGAFFYIRDTAPHIAEEPTSHTPSNALVVVEFRVAAALQQSPAADYIKERVAELPRACGDSPLSYLKSVSAFLVPGEDTHPDWGLVVPHLPPSDVLKPCIEAMMGEQSISLQPFSWPTLIERGLRWGGTIVSSEHQIASPLYGGLVIGEATTVARVLDVARGDEHALASAIDNQLSEVERKKLSVTLPNALARAVLLPPKEEKLRAYWAGRLPGLWPSLSEIRAATAGLAIDDGLRFQALMLAKQGSARQLRVGVDDALSRLQTLAQLVPGMDALLMGGVEVEGDWLSVDVTVPLSMLNLLSRTAPQLRAKKPL